MSGALGSKRVLHLAADQCGEPVAVDAFHAQIIGRCGDALAMYARDRATRPLAVAPGAEAMIRRQREAVLSLESNTLAHVSGWWEQSMESPDPWKTWAALFLVGSVSGIDLVAQILRTLEGFPDDDERWGHAAEAVALVPIPDGVAVGRALVRATCPAARAVGVDMLARRQLSSMDLLREHLEASEPAVMASAARSAARAGVARELIPELLNATRSASAATAWEAARALTLAGVREPYVEIQEGGALAGLLGARGVELLIMAGEGTDISACEALISGTPTTPAVLSAIARFGNATAWSFLLHHLADPDLVDAAVAALRTLFGELVPEAEEASYTAWKHAITEANLNPSLRYRAGKPWQPGTVLAECMSGALPRVEVERRVDELAARTGGRGQVDLGLWDQDARGTLVAFASEVERRASRWPPGAWR